MTDKLPVFPWDVSHGSCVLPSSTEKKTRNRFLFEKVVPVKTKNSTKNILLPIEWPYLPAFTPARTHDSGFLFKKPLKWACFPWAFQIVQHKIIIYLNVCTVIHSEVN